MSSPSGRSDGWTTTTVSARGRGSTCRAAVVRLTPPEILASNDLRTTVIIGASIIDRKDVARPFRAASARLRAREADARKDWAEKLSTDLARRFDVVDLAAAAPRTRGQERTGGPWLSSLPPG